LLNTKDKDSLESQIFYTLVEKPRFGALAKNKKSLSLGSRFTQSDITQGKIIYVHNSDKNIPDSFKFTVQDSGKMYATDADKINPASFFIDIEPVNDAPKLILARGAKVKEQGKILINLGAKLEKGGSFTQEELLDNAIVYSHDGSDSPSDSLKFAVKDNENLYALNTNKKRLFELKFSISPINDKPKLQLNNKLSVNQYNKVIINEKNLKARDVDNNTKEIVYKILSAPLRGDLKLNNSNDIDKGRIVYEHDDDNPSGDEFSFSVSDKDGEVSLTASDEKPATFSFEVNKADLPPLPIIRSKNAFDRSIGVSFGLSGIGSSLQTNDSIDSTITDIERSGKGLGVSFRTALSKNILMDIGLVQRRVQVEFINQSEGMKLKEFAENNFYAKLATKNTRWNFGINLGYKNFNFLQFDNDLGFFYVTKNIPTIGFEVMNSNILSLYNYVFSMRSGLEFFKGTALANDVNVFNSAKFHLGFALEKTFNNYSFSPEVLYTRQVLETETTIQTESQIFYRFNIRYKI